MHRSVQNSTAGMKLFLKYHYFYQRWITCLDSWIDIQSEEKLLSPPSGMVSSFADRDLTGSMHINENLLLEAQKESSRVSSKSSQSERWGLFNCFFFQDCTIHYFIFKSIAKKSKKSNTNGSKCGPLDVVLGVTHRIRASKVKMIFWLMIINTFSYFSILGNGNSLIQSTEAFVNKCSMRKKKNWLLKKLKRH